jgi:hypothetical protein
MNDKGFNGSRFRKSVGSGAIILDLIPHERIGLVAIKHLVASKEVDFLLPEP